ncbi:MAG: UDP-3-O-(3-hydroxymyristoyl)glucosamine N-acyltransferase [candidate division WOR-3 bacterium]|nr:UDP-3-O-(3-hydroxymyristoyl)glucosamine N-acyltransferase [candidate division WOR-3 bacterium]
MKIKEISVLLDGEIKGDPEYEVKNISEVKEAEKGDLVFLFEEENVKEDVESLRDLAAIIPETMDKCPARSWIKVRDTKAAMIKVLRHFYPNPVKLTTGISEISNIGNITMGKDVKIGGYTIIEDGTIIGDGVWIFPFTYIGCDVEIGEKSKIYPHCVILDRTKIGKNVIINPGVVIGSDGFGYYEMEGKLEHIPQVGRVIIQDEVEIGALSMIDRATIGSTVIGRGTKIDNSVQIAHNVKIGANAIVVAQAGIAGSCKVGDRAVIAGQAGIADHVDIGKGAKVAAKSGVMRDVHDGEVVFGYPADKRISVIRNEAYFRKLPELFKRVKGLEESR